VESDVAKGLLSIFFEAGETDGGGESFIIISFKLTASFDSKSFGFFWCGIVFVKEVKWEFWPENWFVLFRS
jgi:hypothetical protein